MATMKINIAYPQYGSQKLIDLDDEKKMRLFLDKRLSEDVAGDPLGDEFKGYIFKITGGMDKQGFAMKQGVALNRRTRLLLDGSTGSYRPKRDGCRKRKSVRGAIIGPDIAVVNLVIIKKGEQALPGLTDPESNKPSLRGPKRATKIRKLWGLSKEEDVRQFVSRKKIPGKEGKKDHYRSPKIQRLVTPTSLHHKRRLVNLRKKRIEKSKQEAAEYHEIVTNLRKEKKQALLAKKRAASQKKSERKEARKNTAK